jgi:hypothetical protein
VTGFVGVNQLVLYRFELALTAYCQLAMRLEPSSFAGDPDLFVSVHNPMLTPPPASSPAGSGGGNPVTLPICPNATQCYFSSNV